MDCLLLLWTTGDCIIVSDSFLLPYGRIIRPGTLLLDLVVLLWSGETMYPCLDPSGLGRRIYFATWTWAGGLHARTQVVRRMVNFCQLPWVSIHLQGQKMPQGGCCSFSWSLGTQTCEIDLNPTWNLESSLVELSQEESSWAQSEGAEAQLTYRTVSVK